MKTTKLEFPWPCEDPFLFCVHHLDLFPKGDGKLGPAGGVQGRPLGQDFGNIGGWNMYHGESIPGFPSHPHRGFETITVVERGLIDHSDSLGGAARYGQGDTQWMTAGKGIVHSEMFPLLNEDEGNPTELFQIWLNLPPKSKMASPHFSMLWAPKIPKLEPAPGVKLTVVAGSLGGAVAPPPPPDSWAADASHEVAVWVLRFTPGAAWTLPKASPGLSRNLYYYEGDSLKLGGETFKSGIRITLDSGGDLAIENGAKPSALLMLQGRPIAAPVASYGPFVMNSQQEIMQAFEDYRAGGFGGWPWKSADPAHAKSEGRFAKFPDGRIERP